MRRPWLPWLGLTALLTVVFSGPVLYAQVAAAATGAPPVPEAANEWGGSLVWAFFSSSVLEWAKRNKWISLFTERTVWFAQRVVGVVTAAAAALGVHVAFTWDPTLGIFGATVSGLATATLWTAFTETARQWVLQELIYRTGVKPYRPATTGV